MRYVIQSFEQNLNSRKLFLRTNYEMYVTVYCNILEQDKCFPVCKRWVCLHSNAENLKL